MGAREAYLEVVRRVGDGIRVNVRLSGSAQRSQVVLRAHCWLAIHALIILKALCAGERE